MITKPDLAWLSRPAGIGTDHALLELDQIPRYLAHRPPAESWDQRLVRHCQCCGERAVHDDELQTVVDYRGIVRCAKHVGRNPCLIEGCGRTFKAQGRGQGFWYANDQIICGQHWRGLIPPGSRERRVLQRIARVARRIGWTDDLSNRESRIWRHITAIARARAAGDIDMDEVSRLMGWDKAA
jgi:hypothetical protein